MIDIEADFDYCFSQKFCVQNQAIMFQAAAFPLLFCCAESGIFHDIVTKRTRLGKSSLSSKCTLMAEKPKQVRKKTQEQDQSERFIETARQIGVDKSGGALKGRLIDCS